MLGQTFKAKKKGLRVKPTYDDIIDETFKPVNVKYPDRKAEATFNSHLFGQVRDAIDETENANQMARITNLGLHRAAAQSGQSFHSVAASVPPQQAPSPIIVDHHLERERFLQEQTEIAQRAVIEAQTQRELTTQRARAQLQYIANEDAVSRQMDARRASELQDYHVAELRQLQMHESNVSESITLRERNAEIALRRQSEENQLQAMYLRRQLEYADRQLRDEATVIQALPRPVPSELRDEVSTELLAVTYPSSGSSSSSSAAPSATNPVRNTSNESASSASSSASTKAKTKTVVTKSVIKAGKTKLPQHATQIEIGLSFDVLAEKPKTYLLDQLDKREVPLTITDRKNLSRDELASLIIGVDTDSTATLSTKLRKKLTSRTTRK